MACPSSPQLSVRRREAEVVVPAKPTPHELKQLSDIDDQDGLRFQLPVTMVYRRSASMAGRDPAAVVREALARTLVFYYPFAGRLVEGPNRKLLVNCRGQGVLFVEADANLSLEQLGDALRPPCPFLGELLYDVPGSEGIIGCPLLLIQVTRFGCGGFVLAIRLNHAMSDGAGLAQFLSAMAECARGVANAPSLPPVWQREILSARNPPRITCLHYEYQQAVSTSGKFKPIIDNANMVRQSCFFGPQELRAIRRHLPMHLRNCTKFELLTACIWRCRTAALELEPTETVRITCAIGARGKAIIDLPSGYYGNAFAFPAAISTAGMLCQQPLGYALELIKGAKGRVTEEYVRSVTDLMALKNRPMLTPVWNLVASDATHAGLDRVDFGWGRPVFGGPDNSTYLTTTYVPYTSRTGEKGVVVPMCLPSSAMSRFQLELQKMIQGTVEDPNYINPTSILSML